MSAKNRGVVKWIFIALGIAFVALGIVLVAANFSYMAKGFPFAGYWAQSGAEVAQPSAPPADGQGFRHCYPWGPWGRPHHGFGGGFIILGIVLLMVFFRRRRWRHHFPGCGEPDSEHDAEEILRRAYAEGRITEEEYKSRLKVLRE